MPLSNSSHGIYLEIGKKKVFAVAVNWPGWCRASRGETGAVEALLAAAPRYARIVRDAGMPLAVPTETADFNIVARLQGNSTTDFGAPDGQLPGHPFAQLHASPKRSIPCRTAAVISLGIAK